MLSYSCHVQREKNITDQSPACKPPNKGKLKFSILNGNNTIAQPPRRKTLLLFITEIIAQFASCSERGRLKKTKFFSLSCDDKRNGHSTKTEVATTTMKLPFLHFRLVVELETLGCGFEKQKTFLERGNFMFFISWTRAGNACVFRPFLFHFSPP